MPSQLPPGEPAPPDGTLPPSALAELGHRPFGVYLHVPFCATRCGYCDFNTYTADELGTSSGFADWLNGIRAELNLGVQVLSAQGRPAPRAETVFVGGGTPSLLGADGLTATLDAVRDSFGLSEEAEVTTESNPESTSAALFDGIRAAGYTRVSLGMQSAAEHVLRTLERRHTPGRAVQAAKEAKNAGFDHVSLDLIYGTPGETDDDLRASLDAVIEAGVDHVSAYSLIVEDGTAMARKVRKRELPTPDEDVLADRYELIDARLAGAGFRWYEVSNWATDDTARCAHNLGYWNGADWWGAGPGAHSHVGGVRWWNVKHPAKYAGLLGKGDSPAAAREILTDEDRRVERVMLELRCASGLPWGVLDETGRKAAEQAVADGLLRAQEWKRGQCVLTDRGRLLADRVVTELVS